MTVYETRTYSGRDNVRDELNDMARAGWTLHSFVRKSFGEYGEYFAVYTRTA